MPRPRYEKLPLDKQERILESAAREFAEHGYEEASMNRILEAAELSKGAAYYYFDDKADLFATVVRHYWEILRRESELSLTGLTAENFWPRFAAFHRAQFAAAQTRPWMPGLSRAVWGLSKAVRRSGPLAETFQQLERLLTTLFRRGQELGLIRTDLPLDLIPRLTLSIDGAFDQWFLSRDTAPDPDEMIRSSGLMLELIQRILSPAPAVAVPVHQAR